MGLPPKDLPSKGRVYCNRRVLRLFFRLFRHKRQLLAPLLALKVSFEILCPLKGRPIEYNAQATSDEASILLERELHSLFSPLQERVSQRPRMSSFSCSPFEVRFLPSPSSKPRSVPLFDLKKVAIVISSYGYIIKDEKREVLEDALNFSF